MFSVISGISDSTSQYHIEKETQERPKVVKDKRANSSKEQKSQSKTPDSYGTSLCFPAVPCRFKVKVADLEMEMDVLVSTRKWEYNYHNFVMFSIGRVFILIIYLPNQFAFDYDVFQVKHKILLYMTINAK